MPARRPRRQRRQDSGRHLFKAGRSEAVGWAPAASTRVPAKAGLKVFLISSGTPALRVGWTLGGNTTLAPKWDSSISSW